MSGQEIDAIVGTVPSGNPSEEGTRSEDTISLALQEVNKALTSTGDTLGAICADIEAATSWEVYRQEFRRFNLKYVFKSIPSTSC